MAEITLKRVYDSAVPGDGWRVLVDRLWPRGLRKEEALVDFWDKDIAPSHELRKWFSHDISKWEEFKSRYRREIVGTAAFTSLQQAINTHDKVTLLYAAKDVQHNNASALLEFLQEYNLH